MVSATQFHVCRVTSQRFVCSSIAMSGWSSGAAGAGLHLVITSISHSDIWIMRHRDSGVGGPSGCRASLALALVYTVLHIYAELYIVPSMRDCTSLLNCTS